MALLEWGYAIQKFFPAEPAGGTAYLSSLASPLPQVRFCPTGGITPEKAPAYLKLSNVITIGGSWMAPKKLVEARTGPGIEALSWPEAAALTIDAVASVVALLSCRYEAVCQQECPRHPGWRFYGAGGLRAVCRRRCGRHRR